MYMEQRNRTQTLPATVVINDEQRAVRRALESKVKTAQKAYEYLSQIEDIQPLPPLNQLTQAWLSTLIENKINSVLSADFLTKQDKRDMANQWEQIKCNASYQIKVITDFINEFGNAVKVDEALGQIVFNGLEDEVKKRSTRQVPTEANEHWDLVSQIWERINQLRDWERSHDCVKLSLENLLTMPHYQFAAMWAVSGMKRDHSQDDKPYLLNSRMLQQMQEKRMI